MVKNPLANAGDIGDVGSNPRSGRSPGEENGSLFSILAWEIPCIEEPGGLQSTGSKTFRHDLDTKQQQCLKVPK